jgi:hypothetical protein
MLFLSYDFYALFLLLVLLLFILGCSFIICYEPCRKMSNAFRNNYKKGSEGLSLRQYRSVDENPYDEINKQVNDAIDST